MASHTHLQEELAQSSEKISVNTQHGTIRGRRAANGAAVFLEVPYALPPKRFADPVPLPTYYKYENKEYILESKHCAQPKNDGQAASVPYEDKVGLGEPSEDPLFVNIVAPSSFPEKTGFPVKVYIHGGFLQFGSPHGLSAQAQSVSAERDEVWVNIGYRLSAFGFLACDKPEVLGNFGFKDQWLGLQWIQKNIQAFGGDPNNVTLTGLSAGAHSVHQILHHTSRLPEGVSAPFHRAILQSNAIATTPKTTSELRAQYAALCGALDLDPTSPASLDALRDTTSVPFAKLTHLIETDAVGTEYGTYRGAWEPVWLGPEDTMDWQRSGGLARGLRAHGVRSVVIGDLSEEWYLYSIAHPVSTLADVERNLERYYHTDVVKKMLKIYLAEKGEPATPEEAARAFGEVLSEGQVHLPVRLFARDMLAAGFPVVRYEIRWTPEQLRPLGYVTHATDRAFWALKTEWMTPEQTAVARAFLDAVDEHIVTAEEGQPMGLKTILALTEDKRVVEEEDMKWDQMTRMRTTLPGEY
ncbi:carboxylesterase [Epithele typhae]|uniref:carboxylesterase n=1 Tax=Epithele typhae TaxID=378194 RepID=UPI0020085A35|nr:carboxylesterase [Epithele typhae]KAH9916951.1 carboxylesterase [Epithele typhae]